jgi:predicted Zn-dependent protease
LKTFLFLLLLSTFSYATYQQVYIGTIDKHYSDKISKEQLKLILSDIEKQLESQLGYNVFDYSMGGKPINIVYVKPSYKKRRILSKQAKLEKLTTQITALNNSLAIQQTKIKIKKIKLKQEYKTLNNAISLLNTKIMNINKRKATSQDEHDKLQKAIAKEQNSIKKKTTSLKQQQSKLNKEISRFKRKIDKYNTLIARYYRVNREIESLSKNFIEVKGITKSNTNTQYTSYIMNGKKTTTKKTTTTMQRIEIYDFEDLQTLKVVLAHELGHLVGVGHIDVKGALMHPLMQEEQKKQLSLTYDDMQVFDEALNK